MLKRYQQEKKTRAHRRVCLVARSCPTLLVTLWTVVCQASLSMGFSRWEYWSRLLCPPPGDLLDPGTECVFLSLLWQAGCLALGYIDYRNPSNNSLPFFFLLYSHSTNFFFQLFRKLHTVVSWASCLLPLLFPSDSALEEFKGIVLTPPLPPSWRVRERKKKLSRQNSSPLWPIEGEKCLGTIIY